MTDEKNYSDAPLENPNDDELNFAPYAQTLAKAIATVRLDNGLVMAIYGEWGSGKSTLINFICHYLESSQKIEIIRFNPWLFSGQEDLTAHFFDQIRAEFALTKFPQWGNQLVDAFEKLSDVLGTLEPRLGTVTKALGFIREKTNKPQSINKIHEEIRGILREKKDARFLIVIDDVDRLYPEEIRQLMGLVKSVANFPNILYLLAFDRDRVANALSPEDGHAFLEKIVQFPFEMPMITQNALDNLFISRLEEIFEGKIPHSFYTLNSHDFYENLRYLITKPRDVFRFLNTFEFTYAGVKGEVDEVDFIIIEMLRMFRPNIYEIIKNNKLYFIGNYAYHLRKPTDIRQHIVDLENQSNKDDIASVLNALFPNLRNDYGNSARENRRKLRLCSPYYFDAYFSYSIPRNLVSKQEINDLIQILQNNQKPNEFFSNIFRYDLVKFRHMIDYLQYDYYAEIRWEFSQILIDSILDISGEVLQIDKHFSTNLHIPIDFDITGLIANLLEKHVITHRYSLLEPIINKTTGYFASFLLVLVVWYIRNHDLQRSGKREVKSLLNPDDVAKLELAIIPKIMIILELTTDFSAREFRDSIDLWVKIEPDNAKKWLKSKLDDNLSKLIEFINGYLKQGLYYELRDDVFLYFEKNEYISMLKQLDDTYELGSEDKSIIDLYLKILNGESVSRFS